MKKEQQNSEDYVRLILEDDPNRIVDEGTITHDHSYIKRYYEFDNGAVVNYEWQEFPFAHTSDMEKYNHKFTLITLPAPNPNKLKPGVIKLIDFPRR